MSKIIDLSKAAGAALSKRQLSVAAAESCTGGALLNALTDVPGSSNHTKGGIVAYSNQVKIEQLGIDKNDIKQYGAVSKTVALQMAKNVAALMKTDFGLSTTGIAGPDGGSDEKPLGTVWMGFWSESTYFALKANFNGDRLSITQQTVELVLETLRRMALNTGPLADNLKLHFADE